MARQERRTSPLDSKFGVLETFEEQKNHLIAAEWRGRSWVFEQAELRRPFTDDVILDLHSAMFAPLLEWAGQTRTADVGPGGKVNVPFHRVREELRKLADDFGARFAALGDDPTVEEMAIVLADTHHRFQWIHPFTDTNGRTGRVLDHFVLWSSFGLVAGAMTSPILAYFPDATRENEYYEGLLEADLYRPERLHRYYCERLEDALKPVFTVHWWDGAKTTTCVAIHKSEAAAVEDALHRSTNDPHHQFRVLGEGGHIVARFAAGRLLNPDGTG